MLFGQNQLLGAWTIFCMRDIGFHQYRRTDIFYMCSSTIEDRNVTVEWWMTTSIQIKVLQRNMLIDCKNTIVSSHVLTDECIFMWNIRNTRRISWIFKCKIPISWRCFYARLLDQKANLIITIYITHLT